jgi:hypothetical protein
MLTPTVNLAVVEHRQLMSFDPSLSYEYFLAISTDTLVIIDRDGKVVKEVIKGNDDMGYLCMATNVDEFLDALMILKQTILEGCDPTELLNI